MMRALIVSDIRFFRESIAHALGEDGLETVSSGTTAPHLAELSNRADVVVVDLVDPGLSHTVGQIDQSAIVGLAFTSDPPVAAAAALGIHAFVGCDDGIAALVRAVRRAAAGEVVCPNSIATVLFATLSGGATTAMPLPPALTRRELEIGRLVTRGMSNREIASALVIQVSTVKNHVHQILQKLDLRRRGQIAAALGVG